MNKFCIARQNGKTSNFIRAIYEIIKIPSICTKQYEGNRILQIAKECNIQPAVLNAIKGCHKTTKTI